MINGYPLNSAPLNGLPAQQAPADPEVIDPPAPLPPPADPYPDPDPGITPPDPNDPPDPANPTQPQPEYPGFPPIEAPEGYSLPWTASVTMAGVDVTARLTGVVRVDRSEGAAGIAEFELYYPTGTSVPLDLHGGAVTIDYLPKEKPVCRLFTGWVAEPDWNAQSRTMRLMCTDRLQQRCDSMEPALLMGMIDGLYSEDFFTPYAEIESNWKEAQDRLSTVQASLDCDAYANMRVTKWKSKSKPDYIFSEGSTVYLSVDVKLAQLSSMTNYVRATVNYRYPRLWQASATYNWTHPNAGGFGGTQAFCAWRGDSTELPTIDMFLSAVAGGGFVPVSGSFTKLPPSGGNICGDGIPWINNQEAENLILGGSVVARKRWVQQITEVIYITAVTEHGDDPDNMVVSKISASASVEYGKNWPTSLKPYSYAGMGNIGIGIGGGSYPDPEDPPEQVGDHAEEYRRKLFYDTVKAVALTEIASAYRQTRVQWQCPTTMALDVDIKHTLELNDQGVRARGKCVQRLDQLDLESGSALTTLAIAIMHKADGVPEDDEVPGRKGADEPATMSISYTLPTQLGGRYWIPEFNEEKDGFSGNYSLQPPDASTYPRRFAASSPEIEESKTDEVKYIYEMLVRPVFYGDILEL